MSNAAQEKCTVSGPSHSWKDRRETRRQEKSGGKDRRRKTGE